MADDIYSTPIEEINTTDPVSSEQGTEIVKNKVNEIIAQFEILKADVNILRGI